MATQSFEQLIAGANKIKQNQLPESNTAGVVGEQLIQMVNKQKDEETERMKGITEYNVSVQHPTSGISGTNKYTLEGAIAKIPAAYRRVGIKCSFLSEDNSSKSYLYQGGTFTSAASWDEIGLSSKDINKSITDSVSDVKRRTKDISEKVDDSFNFCDKNQNVIAKIDKDGLHIRSVDIADEYGAKVFTINRKFVSDIIQMAQSGKVRDIFNVNEDQFVFADKNQNVIAKIDKDGYKAKNFVVVDSTGRAVGTINKNFMDELKNRPGGGGTGKVENIHNKNDDVFYFVDGRGNVIAEIGKDGFKAKVFTTAEGKNIARSYIHPLNGKLVFAFGDSHQGYDNCRLMLDVLIKETGCVANKDINSQLGIGFTSNNESALFKKYEYSIDTNQRSLWGLKDAVDAGKTACPDVIFFEQTHPLFKDTIEAEPFIGRCLKEYNKSSPFGSKTDMQNKLQSDVLNFIKSFRAEDRKIGTVIKVYYNTQKKVITFNGPTSLKKGSFTLNIGEHAFNTEVSEGMTVAKAITALNEWQFADTCDWANERPHAQITDNTLTIVYKGTSPDAASTQISIQDKGTGISLGGVSDSSVANHGYMLFMLHDVNQWDNFSSWKYNDNNTDYEYGYAMTKGMVELAQTLFPTTEIVLWYPNSYANIGGSEIVKYADGSINIVETKKRNTWTNWELDNRDAWKAIAELYSVRFIDVSRNSNISYINYDSWYDSAIHPSHNGYRQWARVIAKLY